MSQNQQIPSGSGECPVCHGTGWKIYREAVEGYKEPLEFARRCSKCKGKRRINDQTGVPPAQTPFIRCSIFPPSK